MFPSQFAPSEGNLELANRFWDSNRDLLREMAADDQVIAEAYAYGEKITLEQAMAYALQEI